MAKDTIAIDSIPRVLLSIRGIGWYSFGAIANSALSIALPAALGRFIDSLVYKTSSSALAFSSFAALSVASLFLGFAMNDYLAVEGNRFIGDIRKRILAKTARLAPARIDGTSIGTISAKFHQDATTAGQLLGTVYARVLGLACALLFAIVLVLTKRPIICLAFLAPLPLTIGLAARRQKGLRRQADEIRLSYQDIYKSLDNYLRPLAFLRALHAEAPFQPDPVRSAANLEKISIANNRAAFRLANEQRLLLLTGELTILAIAGHQVLKGETPIGDMVLFQTMFVTLFSSLSGIFELLPAWEGIREAFRSLAELDRTEEESPGSQVIPANWRGEMKASHLSFSYPGQSRLIIPDLSFHIHPGELVALTGANGSGKTTLLKIISSYMPPTKGELYYGTIPSRMVCKRSLREKLGIVFQDHLILDGSVLENMTLRNPALERETLESSMFSSGADETIGHLPDGLAHLVSASSSLSGGERQKIALARALARKPKVLILDEVSNHLDATSRERLKKELLSWKGKMTILLVSHDPALLELCDQSIVL